MPSVKRPETKAKDSLKKTAARSSPDSMTGEPMRTLPGGETVKKITEFLGDDIDRVDRILQESLQSESELIREVGEYICFTRGKKLRPIVTLLMTRCLNPDRPAPAEVAAAVELIHVATLIHDDVIDKATMRRGRASVNARWGDEVAILMADYLYARAFDLALSSLRPEVLRLLCRVTQKMCEGEMFQLRLPERTFTIRDYFHVIERKTGSLFAGCAALGCMLAGRGNEDVALASSYGNDFGIAFQITDDALDFIARDAQWGKDVGMDVSGGKQTLPFLLAMNEANENDRARMARWMENGREFDEILEMIQRYNGVERALDEARRFADRATDALASLKPVDAQSFEFLNQLPAFVLGRAY
jgi:octaprenyl-diphosphate synthase